MPTASNEDPEDQDSPPELIYLHPSSDSSGILCHHIDTTARLPICSDLFILVPVGFLGRGVVIGIAVFRLIIFKDTGCAVTPCSNTDLYRYLEQLPYFIIQSPENDFK